ncbi:MAG: glycosyltransferase family 4 protein [Planctomycetes bacterium]|nr:glycosyltransferase family 4 protein [Planctomycetota bacterium]MBL6998085.1 glycosyltransferase family 4 protein [Phycisphaerales bacterium]
MPDSMKEENTPTDPMKVVILNQYYAPDVASSGHLLYELAQEIALLGADTSVITCRPSYGPPESWQECPRKETKNGVNTLRMNVTRFSKDSLVGRLVNIVSFMVPLTLFHVLPKRKGRVFLYTTNPPFLGFVGGFISLIFKHKYAVLLHDSYPEIGVWLGKIRSGGLIDRVWQWCNKIMYRRARQIIVLSTAAKDLVITNYGADPERVHVIPNWADPNDLTPKPKSESNFAKKHDLVKPFTVLYSGNLGLYYEFDMILEGARQLLGENFKLVITGAGGGKNKIAETIKKKKLTNTILLGYTPQEEFNDALNCCDALIVTIAKGIDGISFPSKLYTCLSVGRPIIAFSTPKSELRSIIEDNDIGAWFEINDSDGFVSYIRHLMLNPQKVQSVGLNARQLLETHYTVKKSSKAYFDVLELVNCE